MLPLNKQKKSHMIIEHGIPRAIQQKYFGNKPNCKKAHACSC
jgi:hypothetical protein